MSILKLTENITKKEWDRTFRSFIIGSMLGDAYAERNYDNTKTRIRWDVSIRNQHYLDYLYNNINSYTPCSEPKLKNTEHINGMTYTSLSFYTKSDEAFNGIHDYFYKGKLKIVPEDIEKLMCPLSISIWFQDDGSKTGNALRISTNAYSLLEVEHLCHILSHKFGISVSRHKTGKNRPDQRVIYIPTKIVPQFYYLIKPYIHPTMLYKIPDKIIELPKNKAIVPFEANVILHQQFDIVWYDQILTSNSES